jgi:hypothetical protein
MWSLQGTLVTLSAALLLSTKVMFSPAVPVAFAVACKNTPIPTTANIQRLKNL